MLKKKELLKKITPFLLIAVILLGLIGGGTLAYNRREARYQNIISAGDIDIELYNMISKNEKMPEKGIFSVLANINYPNLVWVRNVCEYPAYIRIKITKECTDKEGNTLDSTKMTPNFNTKDWTYSEDDGYYYYNHILDGFAESEPLYESIYFDRSIDNTYKTATLDVHILVEAVQSDNNGESVFDAEGWEVKVVSWKNL